MRRPLLLAVTLLAMASSAMAVTPDEQLPDPKLEARARALSRDLRCVVCQNQSIDESDAALAHDLRVILRERIMAGDTDDEAVAFLVARYGNFVRLKPPFEADTLALWLGPLAILLAGGAGAMIYLRGRAVAPPPLDADQEAELAALMNTDEAR